MKKSTAYIIVVLLVAFVVGIIAVRRAANRESNGATSSSSVSQPSLRPLTGRAKDIIETANNERESSAWQNYPDLVTAEAKEAPYLDVTGCAPEPVVLRVKDKAAFRVRHKDATERILFFTETDKRIIPVGEGVDIAANFGGPGGYSYRCGGATEPIAGVIYVTP